MQQTRKKVTFVEISTAHLPYMYVYEYYINVLVSNLNVYRPLYFLRKKKHWKKSYFAFGLQHFTDEVSSS